MGSEASDGAEEPTAGCGSLSSSCLVAGSGSGCDSVSGSESESGGYGPGVGRSVILRTLTRSLVVSLRGSFGLCLTSISTGMLSGGFLDMSHPVVW